MIMAVSSRQVKNKRNANGELTGRAGTVYDVNIKYQTPEGKKTYSKKGFLTKKEAAQHEADMRAKLINPTYSMTTSAGSKQTLEEYMNNWMDVHSRSLRPSTIAGYKSHIRNHIVPYIGHMRLNQITPALLDNLFAQLFDRGLANATVRYVQRILSGAFEHARKYGYIEGNPARDTITKFGKGGKTPDPYTVELMQQLLAKSVGTAWEMPVLLGGLYGMRRSEILGLRWDKVDLENNCFSVVEQLPFKVPPGTKMIEEFDPTKSSGRMLPITEETKPFFLKQKNLQEQQKHMYKLSGETYYDNNLVIAKSDGAPYIPNRVSSNFGQFLRRADMPHIRFHDLRHTAATNMHELTGDFYTVGEILGHTLKGIGISLGISANLEAVTERYIDVRLERKAEVLGKYHGEVFTRALDQEAKSGQAKKKIRAPEHEL